MTAVLCYKTPASGAARFLPNGDISHARLCLLTILKPAQGNKLGQHRLTCIASYIALYSALGSKLWEAEATTDYLEACRAITRVLTLVSWTGGGFHGS